MATIKINTDKLEASVKKLSNLIESLQDKQVTISQIRSGIEEGWKSSSSYLFIEEFELAQQSVNEMISDTELLSKEILSIIEKAREVEEQNTGDFQSGN